MITNLTEQLERDEDTVLHAYQDSLGFWTIGTGICIDVRKGCGITEEENRMLLNNRMQRNAAALSAKFPWTDGLDEVRRGALLNMVYEMGIDGLAKFEHFLAALEARDFPAAAAFMLDSLWARTQSPARAKRLSEQIRSGTWQ